jgi:hypothetical protein
MQTLFQDSETFQKERPKKLTEQQEQAFYKELADEIIDNGWSQSGVDNIISDLKEVYPFHDNGYELAKELEGFNMSASYDIDVRFVEWLEDLSYEYSKKVEENQKAWVKAHDVKPKFNISDKLKCSKRISNSRFHQDDVVYIRNIHAETGKYVIHKDPDYKGGTVIDFEIIEGGCTLLE